MQDLKPKWQDIQKQKMDAQKETLSVKTISETCQNQKASLSTKYSFDSFQIPSAHFYFWKRLCLMQMCSVLSTLTEQNSQEEHCNSDSFTASPISCIE